MKAIAVNDLTFSYGTNTILEDVNFTVEVGDFAAIIGANGSGKSTLMKVVLGELKADEGQVFVMSQRVKKDMAFPSLRYVPQLGLEDNSTFPASCYELVSTGIYKGLGTKLNDSDRAQIDRAFKMVGMEDFKDRNIGKLSGGQRQRVLLARALVSQPEVLMLDEPTAGVDYSSSEAFYSLLSQLNKDKNITIVTITHELEKIYQHTNRIFCLAEGYFHELDQDQVHREVAAKHSHPSVN